MLAVAGRAHDGVRRQLTQGMKGGNSIGPTVSVSIDDYEVDVSQLHCGHGPPKLVIPPPDLSLVGCGRALPVLHEWPLVPLIAFADHDGGEGLQLGPGERQRCVEISG
jgi:hypothetical protein